MFQICEYKKDEGFTYAEIARRMACNASEVSHLLNGARKLNEDWIIKFCNVLEISLADLEFPSKHPNTIHAEHIEVCRKLQSILDANPNLAAGIKQLIDGIHQLVSGSPASSQEPEQPTGTGHGRLKGREPRNR